MTAHAEATHVTEANGTHHPRFPWRETQIAVLGSILATIAVLLIPAAAPSEDQVTPTEVLRLGIAIVVGVACSVIDLREHRIPNRLSIPAALAIIGSAACETVFRTIESLTVSAGVPQSHTLHDLLGAAEPIGLTLLGAAALGGVLLALAWFGTLGLGDVKLGIVLGGALLPAFGWPALAIAFIASYLLALPHALVLLIARRTGTAHNARAELAFGPYLVAGSLAATLLGTVSLGAGGALPWSDA